MIQSPLERELTPSLVVFFSRGSANRLLTIVCCDCEAEGIKVLTFDLASFESDEEGHWTEVILIVGVI